MMTDAGTSTDGVQVEEMEITLRPEALDVCAKTASAVVQDDVTCGSAEGFDVAPAVAALPSDDTEKAEEIGDARARTLSQLRSDTDVDVELRHAVPPEHAVEPLHSVEPAHFVEPTAFAEPAHFVERVPEETIVAERDDYDFEFEGDEEEAVLAVSTLPATVVPDVPAVFSSVLSVATAAPGPVDGSAPCVREAAPSAPTAHAGHCAPDTAATAGSVAEVARCAPRAEASTGDLREAGPSSSEAAFYVGAAESLETAPLTVVARSGAPLGSEEEGKPLKISKPDGATSDLSVSSLTRPTVAASSACDEYAFEEDDNDNAAESSAALDPSNATPPKTQQFEDPMMGAGARTTPVAVSQTQDVDDATAYSDNFEDESFESYTSEIE